MNLNNLLETHGDVSTVSDWSLTGQPPTITDGALVTGKSATEKLS